MTSKFDGSKLRFTQQIRHAVETAGVTRYSLAERSGVDQAAISRFVRGKGLSMESLDAVAEVLGLSVTIRKGTRRAVD